jgi:signal transduction histidine kinase/ligand-binding sensor domain-containing protein
MCSTQDNMGFMWFGTRDGLNRFDGHDFKVYNFSGHKYESNGNNFVHAIHLDQSGVLWIGTEKDLYKYEARMDSFIHVLSSNSYPLNEIVSDRNNNVWFIAGGVLNKYSTKKKIVKRYEPESFFKAESLCLAPDGVLWVASSNGTLERYYASKDSFQSFNLFSHSNRGNGWIEKIHCAKNGEIFIGTVKTSFKIFDTKTFTYKDISLCEKQDNLFVHSFLESSPNELWIGTETGVFIYNRATGESRKLQKRLTDQYSLSDNVIYTFCEDKEGGIWVGTYFGGINYYPEQYAPFEKYYYKSNENSLSGNVVREIRQDKLGNLWIGTEDGGLNKLDSNGVFAHFKPDETTNSISYICAHSLLPLGNKLWVGTYEHGLDVLNINTGRIEKHYRQSRETGLTNNFPFCFYETRKGEILVGSISGIYSFDSNRDYFRPLEGFSQNSWYMCIAEDCEGTIWTGVSGKGVYYVNKENGSRGNYSFDPSDETSIASNKVNTIFEDSKKRLWFATENGLCRWNAASKNFKRYGTNNGFPTNFILSILEDEKKQLWISTTKGLVCFNPETEKTSVYTIANGLLSDQFNFSSAFKDKNNKMYFGSAKGLVAFYPSGFRQSNFSPPILLTGLQINNQEVGIDLNGSPLTKALMYADHITLKHNQSSFSIAFAVLTYTAPEMVQYAYKLEGLSDHWINLDNNRKIFFNDLPAGSYTLNIKSTNSSGVWQQQQAKLMIRVLPPWWKSWWAYTLYSIVMLSFVAYLLLSYHKRIEEKNKRRIELLELAQEKELVRLEVAKGKEHIKSKVDFLTNVAHEIRTPLTLIKIPLRKIIQKTSEIPDVQKSLKIVSNNTNRLIELTNQLLDFRQLEINEFHLTFTKENISELINEACQSFKGLADEKNLNISINGTEKSVYAFIDLEAFTKIIYNLLSNAVKYGNESVEINLLPYLKNHQTFSLIVENDGHIIPFELKEKIFEPFFRIRETKMEKGTGIGLTLARSLAELHKGELILEPPQNGMNIFSLTLPVYQTKGIAIVNKLTSADKL